MSIEDLIKQEKEKRALRKQRTQNNDEQQSDVSSKQEYTVVFYDGTEDIPVYGYAEDWEGE